jgi:hypothetical protein
MLAAIALVTSPLLTPAFRSVVIAVKAMVVNLVSLGATFGFLVLFWQSGHGSHLIYGVPATGSIRNWIPIVTFAFLSESRWTTRCSSSPACARNTTAPTQRTALSSRRWPERGGS